MSEDIEAAAEAFKRMHGNVCYPNASDGEAKWAAEEIVKAYLERARLSQAGSGGGVVRSGADMIKRHRFLLHADGNCAEIDSNGLAEEIDTALAALSTPPAPSASVEGVAEARGLAAFIRIAAQRRDIPEHVRILLEKAAPILASLTPATPVSAPSPAGEVREAVARALYEGVPLAAWTTAYDCADRVIARLPIPSSSATPVSEHSPSAGEPVAYLQTNGDARVLVDASRRLDDDDRALGWTETPLYATPPAPSGEVVEAGRDLLSYLAMYDFSERDPGEELRDHMARLTAALSNPAPAEKPAKQEDEQ